LPEEAITELHRGASLRPLAQGEILISEGDAPRDVFLVRAGFLRATRGVTSSPDEVLVYFREGDLFGAMSLLLDEDRSPFTVTAVGRAEVVRVPGGVFQRLVKEHPEVRALGDAGAFEAERTARLQGRGRDRTSDPAPPHGASVAHELSWSALVEEGLAEGRALLAIDQRLCTACNGCVEACGRRHGMSRLELSGIQVGPLLFPTACRHCDDPVCLMCSVGGIVRKPSGEIAIVEESCIGCGACAERCPYGNIRVHAVDAPKPSIFDRLLDFVIGPRDVATPADLDPEAARKAVKCDLCAGYDDYACVTACPVGAAFRADPEELLRGDVFGRRAP
jgi:Fe-S-cluster-containing hydrogenase component 2